MDTNANIESAVASQAIANIGKLPVVNAKAKNLAKIEKTSNDFEAVFLGQMLQPMFNSVEVDPLMGGGSAEEIYRSMLADEYGKIIAKQGGVGIAEAVKKEMLKVQGMQQEGN